MSKSITFRKQKIFYCLFLVFMIIMITNGSELFAQEKFVTSPYESDWTEISKIINGIKGVYTSPVDDGGNNGYANGALLGNGELGVVTGGDWHTMKLYVGKNAFWSGISGGTDTTPTSLNVGSISIKSVGANGANSNYSVTQNILEGFVSTSLTIDSKTVQMKTWTSDSKNLIITELSTNSGQNVSIQVNLNVTGSQSGMVLSSGLTGSLLWVEKDTRTTNVPFYCKAVMTTKIFGAEIIPTTNNINTSSATFTLTPGTIVQIVTNIESVKNLPSPRSTVENFMNGLTAVDITNFYTEHVGWWKEFWLKSYISLSDIALQKYWYGHLYTVACCSRSSSEAATGLFGNFITTDTPGWYNDLKLNYNAENPFYGTFSSNHSELVTPYVTAIKNYAVIGRKRVATRTTISSDVLSKMPKGCRGMEFGGGITGFGTEECEAGDFSMPSNATFSMAPIVWYWRYTQDEVFLRNTAYPLLLDCANFYEDYIGAKDVNGIYNVYGATHENGPWDAVNWFTKNSSMDLGAIKFIFKSVIDASTTLGVDANRLAKWQDILANLAPFPSEIYNTKNALKPDSQHSISTVINKNVGTIFWTTWDNINYNTSKDLLDKVRNTLVIIGRWTEGNDYAMSPVIAARAFYNPTYLVNVIKSKALRNNLTVSQEGGGIETSGIVEAINNMLLQSHDGVIRLFPNWVPTLKASFKRLRAQGAFLVDAQYNIDSIQTVSIFSEAGKSCSVQKPWPTKNLKVRIAGGVDVSATQNGDVYTFNTIAGTTYELYWDEMISQTPKIVDLNISLFPNPTSGQINIKSDVIINEISITNIDGQVIMQKQQNSILSSFIFNKNIVAPGIYFAKIKTLKGECTQKLLIQ